MECEKHLTGYFKDGERDVIFSSNEFDFDLMTGEVKNYNIDQSAVIKADDGFIYGKTFDGNNLALYIRRDSFDVLGQHSISTAAFAVANGDYSFSEIVGIRFIGGTLNSLNNFKGVSNISINNEISTQLPNETIEFDCETNGYTFHIEISLFHLESDHSLGSDIQYSLKISFNEPKHLSEVFPHYHTLKRIMSFLTRRQNVGFDSIILIKDCDYDYGDILKDIDLSHDFARVYIKDELNLTGNTDRDNITFDDLGSSIDKIFKLFYLEYNDKKLDYLPENFYPKKDSSAFVVSTDMIKSACTIIEYLTSDDKTKKGKSKDKGNSDLNALISEVNELIKKYKEAENKLTVADCNYYSGQLRFWKEPLKLTIMSLFDKYQEEIRIVSRNFAYKLQYDESAIKEYIDYRNHSTHALECQIAGSVGIIQMIAVVAIYCSILEENGLTRQEIQEICKEIILHTGLYW